LILAVGEDKHRDGAIYLAGERQRSANVRLPNESMDIGEISAYAPDAGYTLTAHLGDDDSTPSRGPPEV